MPFASSIKRTLAFAAALALIACATPYSPPKFEPQAAQDNGFDGALDLLRRHGALHVVWIHGMCPHSKEDWADPRVAALAARLGVPAPLSATPLDGTVYRYELRYDNRPITLDMVVWSPLIEARRRSLCFDSRHAKDGVVVQACGDKADYPYARAALNDMIKSGLMNACLADALIYVGADGSAVRAAIGPAVEAALTMPAAGNPAGVLLVSESLGSKVMFDVLQEILRDESPARDAAREKLYRTRQLVMFANQVPILDLTEPAPAVPKQLAPGGPPSRAAASSLRSFVRAIRPAQIAKRAAGAEITFDRLKVVAFSDPSDILSYRLPQDYFGEADKTDVVNVLVSNASVWFGMIENPDAAHRAYGANDDVMRLFLCGHPTAAIACPVKPRR